MDSESLVPILIAIVERLRDLEKQHLAARGRSQECRSLPVAALSFQRFTFQSILRDDICHGLLETTRNLMALTDAFCHVREEYKKIFETWQTTAAHRLPPHLSDDMHQANEYIIQRLKALA